MPVNGPVSLAAAAAGGPASSASAIVAFLGPNERAVKAATAPNRVRCGFGHDLTFCQSFLLALRRPCLPSLDARLSRASGFGRPWLREPFLRLKLLAPGHLPIRVRDAGSLAGQAGKLIGRYSFPVVTPANRGTRGNGRNRRRFSAAGSMAPVSAASKSGTSRWRSGRRLGLGKPLPHQEQTLSVVPLNPACGQAEQLDPLRHALVALAEQGTAPPSRADKAIRQASHAQPRGTLLSWQWQLRIVRTFGLPAALTVHSNC